MKIKYYLIIISLLSIILSCNKEDDVTEPEVNNPPVIKTITSNKNSCDWGETLTFTADCEDPDGDNISYEWTIIEGQLSNQQDNKITWKAPQKDISAVLKLTISDGENETNKEKNIVVSGKPIIQITSETINFNIASESEIVEIKNEGNGSLIWTSEYVKGAEQWCYLNPDSGTINSGESRNISIIKNIPESLFGNIVNNFSIESNGGNKNLEIAIDIPKIKINKSKIDFGNSSSSEIFEINNIGTGELSWEIISSESWLIVNPNNGTTKTENDIVELSIQRDELNPGTYETSIYVNSNGGNNTLTINCEVLQPVLNITPTVYDFGETAESADFSIKNVGQGKLEWNISSNNSWITNIVPNSGSTQTETDNFKVYVDRSGLEDGNYEGTFEVQSNGGNKTIELQIKVVSPKLSVSPTSLSFGTTSTEKSITINNDGGNTLSWSISNSIDWLDFSSNSGNISAYSSKSINVEVDRRYLDPGNYSGQFSINSNGGNEQITASMTVPTPESKWFKFDDGNFEAGMGSSRSGNYVFVRFTRPYNWNSVRVKKVQIYVRFGENVSFGIRGFDSDKTGSSDNIIGPAGSYKTLVSTASQPIGWEEYDVDKVFYNNEFFICMYFKSANDLTIGADVKSANTSTLRSGFYDGSSNFVVFNDAEFGLRIYVEEVLGTNPIIPNSIISTNNNGIWLESISDFKNNAKEDNKFLNEIIIK